MVDLVLIVGHGRSGTNWLHGLLDLSARTLCRNEPNELPGSPLAAINVPVVDRERDAELDARWWRAIAWTAERVGERDPVPVLPKDHLHTHSQRLGLATIVRRHRSRRLLGKVVTELSQPEWKMPRWLGSRRRLRDAVVVLKTLGVAGWVDWIARRGHDVQIIHCVRHPSGYLDSWSRRWLASADLHAVARDNRERLRDVARVDPDFGARMGDIESMPPTESELWFWRYSTEAIDRAGKQHRRYRRVLYDRMVLAPVKTLQEIYADCGLPWTEAIARATAERSRGSAEIARQSRASADPERRALVEGVCAGSVLESWWSRPARVVPDYS